MSDSPDLVAGPPIARGGWFDDPEEPGRDRWWNGQEWTKHTAKTPTDALFGRGYARSMRTRTNVYARLASWASTTAGFAGVSQLALLLITFLVAIGPGLTAPQTAALVSIAIGLPFLVVLLGVTAIVLGFVGLRRSALLGALAGSIHAIVSGTLFVVVFGIIIVTFALPLLGHA